MIWSFLFAANIAQGLFLMSLFLLRPAKNVLASRLIAAILLAMIITNLDIFITSGKMYTSVPQLFGVSFGQIFLMGPLFYLYTRAVTDQNYTWRKRYALHFLPYLLNLLMNLPLYLLPSHAKISFIEMFLSGRLPVRSLDIVVFSLQDMHLAIYLVVVFRHIYRTKQSSENVNYSVPLEIRAGFVRSLGACFAVFLITVLLLFIFLVFKRVYIPEANHIYTFVTSAAVYCIGYSLFLTPDAILPDFTRKYQTHKKFEVQELEVNVARIRELLEIKQIFTNPDLKVSVLAEELQLPAHQVSKIINESFNKSFNDLINEYRVQEFIARINDPRFSAYTIHGIALEVGFNSKSSFNSIFKKTTGKTPSEYKKA